MESIALEYATPATLKPPANWLRLTSLWCSGLAGAVGVGILLLYAITAAEAFPIAGFYWLGIGAVLTLAGFIFAVVYAAIGRSRSWPAPSNGRRAFVAVMVPILNLGLALGCLMGGLWLMEFHVRVLYIHNMGSTPIETVDLYSVTFRKTIGPIGPGESKKVRLPDRDEFLRMKVTAAGRTVPYDVAHTMAADGVLGQPRHVELVGTIDYRNSHTAPAGR